MNNMKEEAKVGQLDVSIDDIRSSWKVPAIAHFCSLFRSTFSLPDFEIEELEEALFLDAGVEGSDFITKLVVQLLRGIHGVKNIRSEDYLGYLRSVMKERWELGEKRVNPLISQDVTFKALPTLTKVEILHSLCDYRLDAADVTVLKDYAGDNLRVQPLGTDRLGATYWYFYGTRLYKEDRPMTLQERNAKHIQKLKEKRKKKKDRLKAIKRMKEARRKQKQKMKKTKSKGSAKDKKKKSSRQSGDEGDQELVTMQRLQNPTNSGSKNAKKRKNASNAAPSSKRQKNTKSKQKPDSNETPNQRKPKLGDKPKKSGAKKQSLKKVENAKKHELANLKKSGANKSGRATTSKRKLSKSEPLPSVKSATKSKSNTKSSTSTKGQTKASETRPLPASPGISRKRKVVKSKALISESDEDSDDEQPLNKIAKVQRAEKDLQNLKANQKSNKGQAVQKYQKTKPKKATSAKSKDPINDVQIASQTNKIVKKTKRLPKTTSKVPEVTTWSSDEELSSSVSVPQSSDSDTDSEDDMELPRWHLVCHSEDDWQQLTDYFKKSKVKCEKELYKTLANDFLPEIQSLFAAKEKALRKKLQELAPRRASSRVVIMQLKREEEDRLKSIEEAERSSRRQLEEEEYREKMKLRNKLQEQQPIQEEQVESDEPLETPQPAKKRTDSKKTKRVNTASDSVHAQIQQVYDEVRKHEDSWPFQDPVDEAYAPAYYQIIIKPMCLNFIQKKVKNKDYKTKDEFERDMNQVFTNCLEYNGPGNEYTLMAENLKSCLEYSLEKTFPKEEIDSDSTDCSSDTDHYVHQRPPQRQSAKNANTRLEKMDDKVYARLRGLSSSESSFVESQDSSRVDSDEEENADVSNVKKEDVESEQQVKVEQDEDGSKEDDQSNREVSSLDNIDDALAVNSHIKEDTPVSATDDSENDDQTSESNPDKPLIGTTSRNDDQHDAGAFKPRGVIAFAPCAGAKLDIPGDDLQQQWTQACKEENVPEQRGTDIPEALPNELCCKENQGSISNAPLQAPSALKANRIKPIQNVRPYVPDSHCGDGIPKQSLPCEQHGAIPQTSQGPPAMIDLNSRHLDVLNPMTSSPSETDQPFLSDNSLASNQAAPLGNPFMPSSQSQGFSHSKQSAHSGTKNPPQHPATKSENRPELPAPLTVLPNQQTPVRHVPAVQPLLPSNSYQAPHWNEQQSANTSNPFHYSGDFPPPSSQTSTQTSRVGNTSDPTQKFWHPLGFDTKSVPSSTSDKSAVYKRTMANPYQAYPDHKESSQEATAKTSQTNQQSRNILESLLHGRSKTSPPEQCQPSNNASKKPSVPSVPSDRQDSPDAIASKNLRQLSLSSGVNVHYRDTPRQCRTDVKEQPTRSRQPVSTNSPAQTGMRFVAPNYCSPLHNQTVDAAASSQSVIRQPENAMQSAASSIAKQRLASIPQYPTSSDQSNVVSQVDHGKDNTPQVQMRHADRARSIGTMPVGNSESFLSMLATDSRSLKGYKDQFDMRGYAGPRPAYNQAPSSLYPEHLMHLSQANVVPHGYPPGSHLNPLLQPRQQLSSQTGSAFTPHPYSGHSVYRLQRPGHGLFPAYLGQQEAEQLARQQYQQHMQHRASVSAGLAAYRPSPAHTYPDVAYYTQHGVGSAMLGNQPVSGVRVPGPYDPTLLPHPSHMQGYK